MVTFIDASIRNIYQYSNFNVDTNDWMFEMEKKYYKENERIKNVCKKLKRRPEKLDSQWLRMLWKDVHHKIVGCLNAKVGSSTWRYYLYHLLPKEKINALEKRYGPGFHGYYRSASIGILFKLPGVISYPSICYFI